jgi:hypothetical protein
MMCMEINDVKRKNDVKQIITLWGGMQILFIVKAGSVYS